MALTSPAGSPPLNTCRGLYVPHPTPSRGMNTLAPRTGTCVVEARLADGAAMAPSDATVATHRTHPALLGEARCLSRLRLMMPSRLALSIRCHGPVPALPSRCADVISAVLRTTIVQRSTPEGFRRRLSSFRSPWLKVAPWLGDRGRARSPASFRLSSPSWPGGWPASPAPSSWRDRCLRSAGFDGSRHRFRASHGHPSPFCGPSGR